VLAAVIGLSSIVLIFLLHFNGNFSWPEAAANGSALVVSAQTTTGYSTIGIMKLPEAVKAILILCMFTGGSLGSTAGGIKILRVILIGKALKNLLQRACTPVHAVIVPRLEGKRIESEEIHDAMLILALFLLVNVMSWLIFLAAGYNSLN
jgi:trk system potassium uptake protein TrkH